MKDFILQNNKEFLRKRLGSMSQLAGLKRYRLSEGRADGVDAVDVRTGTGFSYTVLPGRGMDIAWTEYKGVPISYMSSTGVSAASHYEAAGMEWLRNFFAGLLTGIGVFDDIARFSGAGTLVPITGFANAVASPAIDSRGEGAILGVGAKIFTVAGPVLLFGNLAGATYGVIYWAFRLF